MQKEPNLSKNQKIIFDLIDKSGGPMKAYSILFNVQKKGIKAPLQVYRALDKLVEIGKIHKIEYAFNGSEDLSIKSKIIFWFFERLYCFCIFLNSS